MNDNTKGYLGEAREGHTSPKTMKETLKSLKVEVLFVMNRIHADFNNNKMSRHLHKCKKKKGTGPTNWLHFISVDEL